MCKKIHTDFAEQNDFLAKPHCEKVDLDVPLAGPSNRESSSSPSLSPLD